MSIVLTAMFASIAADAAAAWARPPLREADRSDDFSYSRYPAYPPYCSTPEAMRNRAVPPLQPSERHAKYGVASTQLKQVVALARHGARTPWSDDVKCWDGYWDDPETATWDCEFTAFTAPPPPLFVRDAEGGGANADDPPSESRKGDDAMFLFEKRFDALDHSPEMANALDGTCQLGQLTLRGYEQMMTSGRHLKDAYINDGVNGNNLAANDERMRLFDMTDPGLSSKGDSGASTTSRWPFEPPNLYYRVNNNDRTVMSGQVLLRGMFGDILNAHREELGKDPVIVTHTADFDYDPVMEPQWNLCPRLRDLWKEAEESPDFRDLVSSEEGRLLRDMMAETLGWTHGDPLNDIVDCLMCTICTDRPLPDVLNDYAGEPVEEGRGSIDEENAASDLGDNASAYDEAYGRNRFWRLMDFSTRWYTSKLTYNDAAYSKLGIGPLWHEIISKIRPVVDRNDSEELEEEAVDLMPPKLALFSGHDSTLMPLLASLGGEVFDRDYFSPYASMVILEIHEIMVRTLDSGRSNSTFSSNHAFRLIYDGEVLTPKVDGCSSDLDLCDVRVLMDRVDPFATIDRDCDRRPPAPDDGEGNTEQSFDEDLVRSIRKVKRLMSTPAGQLVVALLFFAALVLGACLGSLALYFYQTRRLRIRGARVPQVESFTLASCESRTG